mgnify:CR=1 FL=1
MFSPGDRPRAGYGQYDTGFRPGQDENGQAGFGLVLRSEALLRRAGCVQASQGSPGWSSEVSRAWSRPCPFSVKLRRMNSRYSGVEQMDSSPSLHDAIHQSTRRCTFGSLIPADCIVLIVHPIAPAATSSDASNAPKIDTRTSHAQEALTAYVDGVRTWPVSALWGRSTPDRALPTAGGGGKLTAWARCKAVSEPLATILNRNKFRNRWRP